MFQQTNTNTIGGNNNCNPNSEEAEEEAEETLAAGQLRKLRK